jgi:hypothetical protein
MKKALYIVLILIALGLFYVRVRYSSSPTIDPQTPIPSATLIPSPTPILSQELKNDYFTLKYDSSATTSARTAPDSRSWVISYMGQEQKDSGRTQTELFDGYIIEITRFETVGDNPDRVQAEADRQSTIDACDPDSLTEITQGKIGVYPALTFYGGCLGEADYYYLMLADSLYRITAMIVGSDQSQSLYKATVDAMFSSLRFE